MKVPKNPFSFSYCLDLLLISSVMLSCLVSLVLANYTVVLQNRLGNVECPK